MQELIAELTRLYLLDGQQYQGQALTDAMLEDHLRGQRTLALPLSSSAGLTRTLVLHFNTTSAGKGEQQWEALCTIANAAQNALDLPAPAVSISGSNGYTLWLSLDSPVPSAQARRFVALLRKAYTPEASEKGDVLAEVEDSAPLPPCLNQASGKWAAFIHPGMGASFADEPGLEMAPPLAAQAAFLAPLKSITTAQFSRALESLEQSHGQATSVAAPTPVPAKEGLLLKDATLEDIIQFLHAKNIEPTFRYLIEKPAR